MTATSKDQVHPGATGGLALLAIAAVIGLVIATAMQVEALSAARTLLALREYDQLALMRELLLGPVLALAAVSALGRLLAAGAAEPEPLRRLGHISLAVGAAGFTLVLGSALCAGFVGVVVAAGGAALWCAAGALEGLGLLVRRFPSAGLMTRSALRVAGAALAVTLPIGATLAIVIVAEHYTHDALWRGSGDDLGAMRQALRDCILPAVPIALIAVLGATLDSIAEAARRPFVALASTRTALWALALLGFVGYCGHLLTTDGAARAAVGSFFGLALLVPIVVVLGNAIATVWYGALELGALPWAGIGALVCVVERVGLGIPLFVADGRAPLQASALGAAGDELQLAALAFGLVTALHRAAPRLPTPLRSFFFAGALAFAGVQLSLFARLGAATWPRSYLAPAVRSELVATLGLALALFAVGLIATELARALRLARTRRGRLPIRDPYAA